MRHTDSVPFLHLSIWLQLLPQAFVFGTATVSPYARENTLLGRALCHHIDSSLPLRHALERSSEYLVKGLPRHLDRLVDRLAGRHYADIDLLFARQPQACNHAGA